MPEQQPPAAAGDEQRYSLFHGGDQNEAPLKAWHTPYADAFRGVGEVLDLGCGPGYFLDLLRDRGVRGIGIDFDTAMVEAAHRRGHDARLGDHTSVATFSGALGGIHLSHVIEHLWGDDAVGLLEAAAKALAPDGLLIVRTPNWGNATVRRGGFWLDHTHKRPYPLELLSKILADLGMQVTHQGYEPQGWQDTYLLARRPAAAPAATIAAPREPAAAAPVLSAGAARALRARIAWHGEFHGEGSLARVNRHLGRALVALGDVDIVPCGEPTPEAEGALGVAARRREDVPDDAPLVVLRHRWPPHFMNPRGVRYVHIQPWEFGVAPISWADPIAARADDVWCYTHYVRNAYLAAGVPDERVHVVPLGVDPATYHPAVEPLPVSDTSVCIFLFVGGMTPRKNLEMVIDAFLRAFKIGDGVALLVKDNPELRLYDQQLSDDLQRRLAALGEIPPVRFIELQYSDADMARLYRTATALVHPYRGEGFGLPVLEAMACGTPVIVSGGGATDDFVDDTVGYVVPAERTTIGNLVDNFGLETPGWWLTPSIEDLVAAFRRVYEAREEARSKGASAAARVAADWTWHHAALRARERLDALVALPPRPAAAYVDELNSYEGRVFSQNGEDGMLIELFGRLRCPDPFFAEFGVETGVECNAAIFGLRYGWRGLMIEGDPAKFSQLQANYAQRPGVSTVNAFVTRDNIVELFHANGVPLEHDLLSIDVDGNDYYLWETLCGAGFRPRVIVIEINVAYPPPQRWVMAYNPTHTWGGDDYYGASLASLHALGDRLGYALLAMDTNGVNAIFVRSDLVEAAGFPARTAEQAWRTPRYKHSHREGPSLPL